MPLQKLQFRPGIQRDTSNYSAEGTWWDSDKVRFRAGYPEKIGGWQRTGAGAEDLVGLGRAIYCWTAGTPVRYVAAIGTSRRLYLEYQEEFVDISPLDNTTTLANPFTTTLGSTEVVVTWAAHGRVTGDEVYFSGAAAVGGVPAVELNTTHAIVVLTINTFKIKVTTAATSAAVGGGAAVSASAVIGTGYDTTTYSGGWGLGGWGSGGWGASRVSASPVQQGTVWSLDSYGEDLVANRRGGPIHYWRYLSGAGVANRAITLQAYATAIGSAVDQAWIPEASTLVLRSATGDHLIAFGCNQSDTSATLDPLFVRWSDTQNPVEWEPKSTNQAGGVRLSAGSRIVAAVRVRTDILIFTDTAVIAMQRVGGDLVFAFNPLYDAISILSPNAVTVVNGVAYWMGDGKFFAYDGALRQLPCPMTSKVFGELNYSQSFSVACGTTREFDEVTWWYPSGNNVTPDSYVTHSFRDQVWYGGTMARSAWQDQTFRGKPYAANPYATTDVWGTAMYKTRLLIHELGPDDMTDGTAVAIPAYAETADFDISEGHNFAFASKLIPDVRFDGSVGTGHTVTMTLYPRTEPGNTYMSEPTNAVVQRDAVVDQFTNQVDIRLRGRQMKLKIASTGAGVRWKLGTPRVDIRPDGRRS